MKSFFLLFLFLFGCTQVYTQSSTSNSDPYRVQYRCPPCNCPEDGKVFNSPGVCRACNMALRASVSGLEGKPIKRLPRKTVAILLFDGADIMDVTGPMSVFEHAGFDVFTVAKDDGLKLILSFNKWNPDHTFETLPKVDVIMVPGGGPAESNQDPTIVDWLKQKDKETETLFSVCSGAFFLAKAGLLDGLEATTFALLIPDLKNQFPKVNVLNDVKYTNNGHVVTSSGLSSGIDASFEVVAKYYGAGAAQDIANHMEYPWKRKHDYARTQLADNYIQALNRVVRLFATRYTFSEGDHDKWEYRFQLWGKVQEEEFVKFMHQEIQKMEGYESSKLKGNVIKAKVNHVVLGPGNIELSLHRTGEEIEVRLLAQRIVEPLK